MQNSFNTKILVLNEQSNIAQVNKKSSSALILPAADLHAVVVAGVRRTQTLVAGMISLGRESPAPCGEKFKTIASIGSNVRKSVRV
jgi:hypothetical protein